MDRLLQAAAERGVKVNIIVYKEVAQALTRKFLTPLLPEYIHSILPNSTPVNLKTLTRLSLYAALKGLEAVSRRIR